jgi:transcriptional regulator with XRE-family HTH domain
VWIHHTVEQLAREHTFPKATLATRLGVSEKTLWRWENQMEEVKDGADRWNAPAFSFNAATVEEALAAAGVHLYEVYPWMRDYEPLPESHCERCEEKTPREADGTCIWCGPVPRKRRTYPIGGRYSRDQLHELHRFHERGLSINALARKTHARVGYPSWNAAALAIRKGWKRIGLQYRDQRTASRLAIRRWKRRNPCKGETRAGGPCRKAAAKGSDFCLAHDPSRREEITRNAKLAVERKRALSVPLGPFATWLNQQRDRFGTWTELAEVVGVDPSLLSYWARGGARTPGVDPLVEVRTVEKYLAIDDTTTFTDLYPDYTPIGAT